MPLTITKGRVISPLITCVSVCILLYFWSTADFSILRVRYVPAPMSHKAKEKMGLYRAEFGAVPQPAVPLVHPEEVALRIIVLVYNRRDSLLSCINSIKNMDADGDVIALDIFVDKGKNGAHHQPTVDAAMNFSWSHGPVRVHLQKEHVGLYGQWIDSWRPQKDTKELAVIIEDDLDVSKYFWKWLKAAHGRFGNSTEVQGFSLRGNPIIAGARRGQWLPLGTKHTAFMYKVLGSHGYVPLPDFWRHFQDWFHVAIHNKTFRPYHGLPPMAAVDWYKGFERTGRTDSMWEMWCLYYGFATKTFVVYPNIGRPFKLNAGELIVHRAEAGLHSRGGNSAVRKNLLREWRDEFIQFDNIEKYDFDGNLISNY